jgi:hypothetical protein
LNTNSENFDEEGLLKVIKTSDLSEEIAKLTWNWNNFSNPVKVAHELMARRQKLHLEITEYMERVDSTISEYQRNQINNSIDDLGKLIPRMKNKIKPTESLEIVDQTDNSLV